MAATKENHARTFRRVPLRLGSHHAGEPAYSLFDRLAARAGVPARDLARDYGLNLRSIRCGRLVETVAALADVDASGLRAATLVANARKAELNGTRMERRLWDLDRNVHCPVCVQQDRERQPELASTGIARRTWWDCKVVYVCPEHGVRLEATAAHACGDGRMVPDPSGEEARRVDASWEAYLVGRFGFGPERGSDVLDDMDVDAAVISVALFGWVARFGKFERFDFQSSFADAGTIRAGYEVLANADALARFLDRLWIEDKSHYKHAKCASIYGELYRWYYYNNASAGSGNKSAFASIRRRIRDHALSRLPLGTDPKIFGEICPGRGLLPMPGSTRARRAGDHEFYRLAVGLGVLAPELAEVEWKKIGVTREAIEQVRSFQDSTISARKFATQIKAPWPVVSALVREGRLTPDMIIGSGAGRTYWFRPQTAAALLDRLAGSAPDVSEPKPRSATVTAAAAACGIQRSILIAALFDGRISASGRLIGIEGFPGILVFLDDVEALASAGAEERLLPLKQAGLRMGVEAKSVRLFAKRRIVCTSSIGRSSKRGANWLATSEIIRFGSVKGGPISGRRGGVKPGHGLRTA